MATFQRHSHPLANDDIIEFIQNLKQLLSQEKSLSNEEFGSNHKKNESSGPKKNTNNDDFITMGYDPKEQIDDEVVWHQPKNTKTTDGSFDHHTKDLLAIQFDSMKEKLQEERQKTNKLKQQAHSYKKLFDEIGAIVNQFEKDHFILDDHHQNQEGRFLMRTSKKRIINHSSSTIVDIVTLEEEGKRKQVKMTHSNGQKNRENVKMVFQGGLIFMRMLMYAMVDIHGLALSIIQSFVQRPIFPIFELFHQSSIDNAGFVETDSLLEQMLIKTKNKSITSTRIHKDCFTIPQIYAIYAVARKEMQKISLSASFTGKGGDKDFNSSLERLLSSRNPAFNSHFIDAMSKVFRMSYALKPNSPFGPLILHWAGWNYSFLDSVKARTFDFFMDLCTRDGDILASPSLSGLTLKAEETFFIRMMHFTAKVLLPITINFLETVMFDKTYHSILPSSLVDHIIIDENTIHFSIINQTDTDQSQKGKRILIPNPTDDLIDRRYRSTRPPTDNMIWLHRGASDARILHVGWYDNWQNAANLPFHLTYCAWILQAQIDWQKKAEKSNNDIVSKTVQLLRKKCLSDYPSNYQTNQDNGYRVALWNQLQQSQSFPYDKSLQSTLNCAFTASSIDVLLGSRIEIVGIGQSWREEPFQAFVKRLGNEWVNSVFFQSKEMQILYFNSDIGELQEFLRILSGHGKIHLLNDTEARSIIFPSHASIMTTVPLQDDESSEGFEVMEDHSQNFEFDRKSIFSKTGNDGFKDDWRSPDENVYAKKGMLKEDSKVWKSTEVNAKQDDFKDDYKTGSDVDLPLDESKTFNSSISVISLDDTEQPEEDWSASFSQRQWL